LFAIGQEVVSVVAIVEPAEPSRHAQYYALNSTSFAADQTSVQTDLHQWRSSTMKTTLLIPAPTPETWADGWVASLDMMPQS
jgi:hypothetical protein